MGTIANLQLLLVARTRVYTYQHHGQQHSFTVISWSDILEPPTMSVSVDKTPHGQMSEILFWNNAKKTADFKRFALQVLWDSFVLMFWRESNTPAFWSSPPRTCWRFSVVTSQLLACVWLWFQRCKKKDKVIPGTIWGFHTPLGSQGYLTKWSQILGLVRWCQAVKPAELALRDGL